MKCLHLGNDHVCRYVYLLEEIQIPIPGPESLQPKKEIMGLWCNCTRIWEKGVKIEVITRRFCVLSMGPSARGDMVGRTLKGDFMRRLRTPE
jgi:hypothetical protein